MTTMMTDFYYQIKGKRADEQVSLSNWVFPPIFSGKVSAENKKKAKELVCEEYEKKFPTRVLHKDLESNEFLLSIEEIKQHSHLQRLFDLQHCKMCNAPFYVIDKYNDHNERNKGSDYCSEECRIEHVEIYRLKRNENEALIGSSQAVIYKITNKITGMVYVGKTSQVFTLRWYQHFFQGTGTKFHDAIKKSKVTDWTFEVQEIVELPKEIKENADLSKYLDNREAYIFERERFWIDHYNSIENGYNSV